MISTVRRSVGELYLAYTPPPRGRNDRTISFPRDRRGFSRSASPVSPNNEYDTTWLLDEMRAPARSLRGKERCERSASPRREDEAKTSFVRPFRGEERPLLSFSLARWVYTLALRTLLHEPPRRAARSDRDLGLHFSSDLLLVKLP